MISKLFLSVQTLLSKAASPFRRLYKQAANFVTYDDTPLQNLLAFHTAKAKPTKEATLNTRVSSPLWSALKLSGLTTAIVTMAFLSVIFVGPVLLAAVIVSFIALVRAVKNSPNRTATLLKLSGVALVAAFLTAPAALAAPTIVSIPFLDSALDGVRTGADQFRGEEFNYGMGMWERVSGWGAIKSAIPLALAALFAALGGLLAGLVMRMSKWLLSWDLIEQVETVRDRAGNAIGIRANWVQEIGFGIGGAIALSAMFWVILIVAAYGIYRGRNDGRQRRPIVKFFFITLFLSAQLMASGLGPSGSISPVSALGAVAQGTNNALSGAVNTFGHDLEASTSKVFGDEPDGSNVSIVLGNAENFCNRYEDIKSDHMVDSRGTGVDGTGWAASSDSMFIAANRMWENIMMRDYLNAAYGGVVPRWCVMTDMYNGVNPLEIATLYARASVTDDGFANGMMPYVNPGAFATEFETEQTMEQKILAVMFCSYNEESGLFQMDSGVWGIFSSGIGDQRCEYAMKAAPGESTMPLANGDASANAYYPNRSLHQSYEAWIDRIEECETGRRVNEAGQDTNAWLGDDACNSVYLHWANPGYISVTETGQKGLLFECVEDIVTGQESGLLTTMNSRAQTSTGSGTFGSNGWKTEGASDTISPAGIDIRESAQSRISYFLNAERSGDQEAAGPISDYKWSDDVARDNARTCYTGVVGGSTDRAGGLQEGALINQFRISGPSEGKVQELIDKVNIFGDSEKESFQHSVGTGQNNITGDTANELCAVTVHCWVSQYNGPDLPDHETLQSLRNSGISPASELAALKNVEQRLNSFWGYNGVQRLMAAIMLIVAVFALTKAFLPFALGRFSTTATTLILWSILPITLAGAVIGFAFDRQTAKKSLQILKLQFFMVPLYLLYFLLITIYMVIGSWLTFLLDYVDGAPGIAYAAVYVIAFYILRALLKRQGLGAMMTIRGAFSAPIRTAMQWAGYDQGKIDKYTGWMGNSHESETARQTGSRWAGKITNVVKTTAEKSVDTKHKLSATKNALRGRDGVKGYIANRSALRKLEPGWTKDARKNRKSIRRQEVRDLRGRMDYSELAAQKEQQAALNRDGRVRLTGTATEPQMGRTADRQRGNYVAKFQEVDLNLTPSQKDIAEEAGVMDELAKGSVSFGQKSVSAQLLVQREIQSNPLYTQKDAEGNDYDHKVLLESRNVNTAEVMKLEEKDILGVTQPTRVLNKETMRLEDGKRVVDTKSVAVPNVLDSDIIKDEDFKETPLFQEAQVRLEQVNAVFAQAKAQMIAEATERYEAIAAEREAKRQAVQSNESTTKEEKAATLKALDEAFNEKLEEWKVDLEKKATEKERSHEDSIRQLNQQFISTAEMGSVSTTQKDGVPIGVHVALNLRKAGLEGSQVKLNSQNRARNAGTVQDFSERSKTILGKGGVA